MSKKNKMSKVLAVVAEVTEQATLQSMGVQSEPYTVPQKENDTNNIETPLQEHQRILAVVHGDASHVPVATNKLQVYKALSEVQRDIEVDENTVVPLTNKRAMVAALYCVVCKALGVNTATPGTMQQPIVR